MDDINLSFLLYLVDPRETTALRFVVERSLGCTFSPMVVDAPDSEKAETFETVCMGIYLSLERVATWPEGNVYRFGGGTDGRISSVIGVMVSMDSHVMRLLEHAGCTHILTPSQFVLRNRQLKASAT
jgi:hypothetical protein